ncbi:MAG: hypothetical protein JWP97_494 [Labilithrix sp.]|nr:hypothetical protein [Labilithrix sp.]
MKSASVVLGATAAASLALVLFACTGDDPAPITHEDVDAGSSSGSSGSSGSSSGDAAALDSGPVDAGADAYDAAAGYMPDKAMIAFVTSGQFGAQLGGLAGADAYCQQAARNVSLPGAEVDGTYLAWLANTPGFDDPLTRFARSTGGYKRVDGLIIAASWDELTSGQLRNPIDVLENGTTTNGIVWTNVATNGTATGTSTSCGSWMVSTPGVFGGFGSVAASDQKWTASGTVGCDGLARLLCFQQQK